MRIFLAVFALSFVIQCIFAVVFLAADSFAVVLIWAWPLLLSPSPIDHASGLVVVPFLIFFYAIGFGILANVFKTLWKRSSW